MLWENGQERKQVIKNSILRPQPLHKLGSVFAVDQGTVMVDNPYGHDLRLQSLLGKIQVYF